MEPKSGMSAMRFRNVCIGETTRNVRARPGSLVKKALAFQDIEVVSRCFFVLLNPKCAATSRKVGAIRSAANRPPEQN